MNAVARWTDTSGQLSEKIADRSARVGVVGLGYVGLPFAVLARQSGFPVIGFDLSERKVEAILSGKSYIGDVPDSDLTGSSLEATTEMARLADCDVIVLAVPTPLTKHLTPDLTPVISATESVASHLRPGQLVALESTTYPGTTEEVLKPILDRSGLEVEVDYFLAHSPERVDPGNKQFQTKNTNKVVGGVGPASLDLACQFYAATVDHIVPVSSASTAEMVKVYENIFRSVNIGLVNEMMLLCDRMGLNVWEVLRAAFTKPFGIMPFFPGPGVGGHCIPLDPHYLEYKAREYSFATRFIQVAGEVNRSMPRFVVDKSARLLNAKGIPLSRARVLLLGVAYKKNIDDYRESPALDIFQLFQQAGSAVSFSDPHVPAIHDHGISAIGVSLSKEMLENTDLVVLITDHEVLPRALVLAHAPLILDTRDALPPRSNVVKL